MNNKSIIFVIFAFTLAALTAGADVSRNLKCLWVAYPEFKIGNGGAMIQFADGTRIPYSDEKSLNVKDHFEQVEKNVTTLEQMFAIPYKKSFQSDSNGRKMIKIPEKNEDPGRLRHELFFKKIYGESEPQVQANLVSVNWLQDFSDKPLLFNKKFGAAAALQKVSDDLVWLIKERPDLKKYVTAPLGGTFLWRKIAGSPNLSFHSFGAAIDINTSQTDYWQWNVAKDKKDIKYKNRIPLEIVEVFEKRGFIWGGKWDHYDSMHFEFRPELMLNPEYCEQTFAKYYR